MSDELNAAEETQVQQLKSVARHITDEDFQRDQPPPGLWAQIAAAAQRPAASDTPAHRGVRRRGWIVGVAAAVVAAVIAGVVVSSRHDDRLVASAALSNEGLSPLGATSTGRAEILRRGASQVLRLDVRNVPRQPDSYVEVWMIDRQVKGMVSLGPFHGDGDYAIPSGIDPASFPIVDLSIEPADGVPTHSGVSIVRGVTGP